MTEPSKREIVSSLLDKHGRTYSDELGIDLGRNTPSPLFRWLCASILFSARISTDIAMRAARALTDQGCTTAQKMAASTWEQRTRTLNRSGYARYDESTSRMLGYDADLLLERYGGDLRKLREEANRDPNRERAFLKEFKGIGDVGVDIFFREAQIAWDEIFPFADKRALQAARRLDLGADARALARHVERREFPRLVAALVRVSLSKAEREALLADAG